MRKEREKGDEDASETRYASGAGGHLTGLSALADELLKVRIVSETGHLLKHGIKTRGAPRACHTQEVSQ